MLHTSFVVLAIISSLSFSSASILTSALTESDIRLSDEGYLIYGSLPDITKAHLFRNYMDEYAREYPTTSEIIMRYDLFKQSLVDMDKLNAEVKAENGSTVFGITVFADMSPQEFHSQYLSLQMPERAATKSFRTENVGLVKTTGARTAMDWRNTTSPIKDQGPCGSCWAQQAVAQIEADAVKVGLLTPESMLSTMQVTRCTYGRDGCGGGWTSTAWDYVTKIGGITFADFYPYDLSQPLECDATKKDFTVTVSSWHELDGEQAMIDYVLNKGTLSVAVDATLWGSYRGGIFSSCTLPIKLNHGVNIVGVNTVERYWIIRNSWGSWWGENGYMRLAMGSNQCGLAYWAGYTEIAAANPAITPRYLPTQKPTRTPTIKPTPVPTSKPTTRMPTPKPTLEPTVKPNNLPTLMPTGKPISPPTLIPTSKPTEKPTPVPSSLPSAVPSGKPFSAPSFMPTVIPGKPSTVPTSIPSGKPIAPPSVLPTTVPTSKPTMIPPTAMPSAKPIMPTSVPTEIPTIFVRPTRAPVTRRPSRGPRPTRKPTQRPTATKFTVNAGLGSASPSSPPQVSISALLSVTQVVSGLSELQTADYAFVGALSTTLITLLGEGTSVSDVTLSSHGRRLLANQHMRYTITETNGMTAEDITEALEDAMDSGDFFAVFSANAGVLMNDVTNLQTVDLAPNDAPTQSPKKEGYSATISTAAVAGGCIGGVLLAFAISYYLYKAKTEKPKAPTIHMYSENESGDFIPFTADTMADIPPPVEADKKCDFTIIYPIAQE